ncbi:MAG: DNA polymerase I [Erysipelotrichaceae bacterium]|nr:DNA polymerase I [Erysipelotrichaceae bacterium]MBQ2685724.1 DNA polymerase I [Erysipelotrichaceae bacterium]
MSKLLLIDGNSMLFRAYFATVYGRPMSTSAGIPTNAVFGFATMLQKAIEVIEPDSVIIAFDHDKHNFRTEIYKDYKGTRQTTPDSLVIQFPIVREYIDAIGMKQYEQHGIEADDIIGSLSRKYADEDVNILTSDKDMLQLINDNTKVWLMKKGITEMECMDEQALYDRFQLKPLQIIDLKGLSGDPSDNIPGVTKVGDKTAIKLLNEYGTVEGLYDHIDEIKGKLKENLVNDKDMAFLSKMLATIKTDAEIDIDLDECGYDFSSEKAMEFYSKYEMRSFLNEAKSIVPSVKKKEEVKEVRVSYFGSEMLTDRTAIFLDEHDGMAFSNEKGNYYISFEDALRDKLLKEFLGNEQTKILYDVKRWYHLLDKTELSLKGKIIDLKIAAFLSDSKIKNLDDLLIKYHATVTPKQNSTQLDLFGGETVDTHYPCEVASKFAEISDKVMKQLDDFGMNELYWKLELPLAEVLFEMERKGVCVRTEVLDAIAEETTAKLEVIEKKIYELAGRQFNINSPKQLAEVIYDDLALMRSSKRSTDASVLKKLENKHPIIPEILEYRKYAKLNSTYAIGLKKYVEEDGKIHSEFNQCIAETGRLSSSNPNLQNISVRNEEAMMIRKAFIPEEGCVFVGADYSQVELRILAHMADEKALIEAFKNGMDIHTKTAMDVFGVEEDEVTSLMRRQAKAINFGIDYGMTDFGLAERLDIPVWQAKEFISQYFERYPNVRRFMDKTIEDCKTNGYVTTLLNRRREIPEINSSNHSLKEFGKRAAMNAPIQGSAADLIKIAMLNVRNRLKKEGLKSEMILQIHDELILNVPVEEKDRLMVLVEEEMENAMELKVPLLAQTECGSTWLEVK